jgi:hypothetical protein
LHFFARPPRFLCAPFARPSYIFLPVRLTFFVKPLLGHLAFFCPAVSHLAFFSPTISRLAFFV